MKGEMSIGVVVALALGLIILLLLMGALVSKFNLFGKGTDEQQTGVESRICAKVGSCRALIIDPVTKASSSPCPGKEATQVSTQGWIDCASTCCKP